MVLETLLTGLPDVIEKGLAHLIAKKKGAQVKREIAHHALTIAVTETRLYIERKKEGDRNRELEETLVRLWRAAGNKFEPLDKDIAMHCRFKADAWINPKRWTKEKREERGATLLKLDKMLRAFGKTL